ncbi:MAG TPA: transketolase C-terminal domain-containing protein, partial [Bacteroidales bacterium]|nr:transketolase C-terminal domain-containing protein [Bacteroidales bacterium]
WAVKGTPETYKNVVTSIELDFADLEAHNEKLQKKYAIIEEQEVRYEEYRTDDAEIVLIGYGISSRVVQSAINELRADGIKAGMLRLITLFPFPIQKIKELAKKVDSFLVVEMSNGQMIDDVRLAVEGKKPVHFHNRMGGFVPTAKEIREKVVKIMR